MTSLVATVLTAPTMRGALLRFAALLLENQPLLTELDRVSGDGDHGTTMAAGAARIGERLRDTTQSTATPAALLRLAGNEFLALDGGAAGPLFGCMLRGMARSCTNAEALEAGLVSSMLQGGLSELHSKSHARAGDKTMLDALTPAVEAAAQAAVRGDSVSLQLHAAARAAQQGAESTRLLVARFGRARNLGDRTLHHADPGATSLALFFRALAEAHPDTLPKDTDDARL